MNLQEAIKKYGNREVNEKELENIFATNGRWKPIFGDEYYYIDGYGDIDDYAWDDDCYDNFRWNNFNVYKTRSDAEKALEINTDFQEYSFVPAWDGSLIYILAFDAYSKKMIIQSWHYMNIGAKYYFESEENAQYLIDKYPLEDIKKIHLPYVLGDIMENAKLEEVAIIFNIMFWGYTMTYKRETGIIDGFVISINNYYHVRFTGDMVDELSMKKVLNEVCHYFVDLLIEGVADAEV